MPPRVRPAPLSRFGCRRRGGHGNGDTVDPAVPLSHRKLAAQRRRRRYVQAAAVLASKHATDRKSVAEIKLFDDPSARLDPDTGTLFRQRRPHHALLVEADTVRPAPSG